MCSEWVGMLASIIIGMLIFGYAGWTLFSYVKKTKKGKCAGCSVAKTCASTCSSEKAGPPHNNER